MLHEVFYVASFFYLIVTIQNSYLFLVLCRYIYYGNRVRTDVAKYEYAGSFKFENARARGILIGGEYMAKKKKFSPEELSGFCSQVAGMLKSGIDLEEGMYMLAEEMEDQRTRELIEQVENSLKENESFSKALKGTGAFPAYLINMVGIGETSGKLEDVMRAMVRYYDRESMMRESIRNVIAYPMMMFLMIAVILVACPYLVNGIAALIAG